MEECECSTWARDFTYENLWYTHHPKCPNHDPEVELKTLISELVCSIETWAYDEDGIPEDCWVAYCSACRLLGRQPGHRTHTPRRVGSNHDVRIT